MSRFTAVNSVAASLRVLRRQAYVSELHSLGIAGGVALRLLNVERETFYKDARELGLKFPYDTSRLSRRRADYQGVVALREQGKTLEDIAARYGVSRQRIHQIVQASPPT